MKFVSFTYGSETGYGVLEAGMVLRLDTVLGAAPDLATFIARSFPDFAVVCEATQIVPLRDIILLPPIPRPGRIFCIATNFHESGKPVPEYPLLFTRHGEAQTGHQCPILKPAVSEKFDFEGELAVIIGKRAHKIARAEAMSHVAGYTCFNDGTMRDWQKHSSQFTAGKNFYLSGGFGPWMVCQREIPDPRKLALETRVNGVVKQAVTMDHMIFDIAFLISYISSFSPLDPGDVIVTGTPSGFGSTRNPPEFLNDGDVVEVEISDIGCLRNTVRQDIGLINNFVIKK